MSDSNSGIRADSIIDGVRPGETVVHLDDGTRWRVLYHDIEYKVATCERTDDGRNIVRAIRDDELRKSSKACRVLRDSGFLR